MKQQSQDQQPFIPLSTEGNKQSEIKTILQKLIKQLSTQEYYFLSHLISTNVLYNDLEQLQQTLNNDPKFNLWKLFEYFDTNGDRKLQFEDFFMTLQKLDIVLKKEELYMLFKKLGGEDDDIISYAEFSEIFKFGKYQQIGLTRIAQNYVLSQEQQQVVHQLFSIYMKIEKSTQHLREQIGQLGFLEALFRNLDYGQKGYLIHQDLVKYLNSKGIKTQKTDLLKLFYRLQKYKSGRCNFEEFLSEFAMPQIYMEYQATQIQQDKIESENQTQNLQQQQLTTLIQQEKNNQESDVIQKPSILNNYMQPPQRRSEINESDDSIRLPGFTRYIFQS